MVAGFLVIGLAAALAVVFWPACWFLSELRGAAQ
jgi:hypothetical protein